MRCYQHIGLKDEARKFLAENVKRIPNMICSRCGHVMSDKMDYNDYDHKDLFYGDGPTLSEYKLKDGTIAREILQCAPWSSGPMGFLCLEINGERKFEWSDQEIFNMG